MRLPPERDSGAASTGAIRRLGRLDLDLDFDFDFDFDFEGHLGSEHRAAPVGAIPRQEAIDR